jgi:hypothetical protein
MPDLRNSATTTDDIATGLEQHERMIDGPSGMITVRSSVVTSRKTEPSVTDWLCPHPCLPVATRSGHRWQWCKECFQRISTNSRQSFPDRRWESSSDLRHGGSRTRAEFMSGMIVFAARGARPSGSHPT